MQKVESEGKFYLGKLCLRGHDHEDTGQTLRYNGNKGCRICEYARTRRRHREKLWRKAMYPPPGFCESCGKITGENTYDLCFDHNHETGAFRGWLCGSCNTSIGKLGDNIEGLKKALDYLEKAAL